jgi:hypothetical protein
MNPIALACVCLLAIVLEIESGSPRSGGSDDGGVAGGDSPSNHPISRR